MQKKQMNDITKHFISCHVSSLGEYHVIKRDGGLKMTEQLQYNEERNLHDQCVKLKFYHVTLTMNDGSSFDGIIEDVDSSNITVLVGEDVLDRVNETVEDQRYYGGYGYGRPRRRFRRFRRRTFPIATLAALALLPYIAPTPYYAYSYY